MALKALKCPNCDANIQVDDNRDYGFCSYCGAQVQVREVVEVRYSEKMNFGVDVEYIKELEAGRAFHKIGDFYKAEMLYMKMLRDYPGKAEVYEGLVCTITRNYTLFISENVERVNKLMEKMVLVASEEEKPHYVELQEKVLRLFGEGMITQQKEENRLQIIKYEKMIRENKIMLVCSLVFAFVLFGMSEGNYILSRIGLMACIIAVCSVVMIFSSNTKKDKLLKRQQELENSIL